MTDEPLTPTQIAGKLTAALATIRDLWKDMSHPTYGSLGPKVGSGDLDRIERIANTSRAITDDLRAWCHIMHDDLMPDVRTPNLHDVADMVRYLLADIDMFAHRPEALDDMTAAEGHAAAITALVYGAASPDMALCPCPFDCAGTVRATPLRNEDGLDLARCDTCRELLPIAEWQRQHGVTENRDITKAEVITLAHRQFGISLTEHGITCLVSRGRLSPVKPDTRPQTFRLGDVVQYLTRRQIGA